MDKAYCKTDREERRIQITTHFDLNTVWDNTKTFPEIASIAAMYTACKLAPFSLMLTHNGIRHERANGN